MKKILTLIFLFLSVVSTAQKMQSYSYKDVSLLSVLKDIQNKNDIEFSFASNLTEGKTVTLRAGNYSLQEIIQELSIQATLEFKKIDDKQYIIIAKVIAGKYCGYVLDAESHFPINNAAITLQNGEEILTDINGFYEFNTPQKEPITIKATGYKIQNVTLSSKGCLKTLLQIQEEELSEVIVSSYVTSGIDRNKDGSIDVDTDRLGILPGLVSADIAQSIQLIPGITSLDESATGIQIRGGSADQNLVLYDNIKLYNTGYFYGMFSLFNPFATKSARIFRSGTSANYGDRISGIIDVSSGNDISTKTEGGFEIDGISVNGFVKTPLSKTSSLYLFARRSYGDIWRTPTYNSYADKIFTNFGVAKDINGNVLQLETDDDYNTDTSTHSYAFGDINTKLVLKPNAENTYEIGGLYTKTTMNFEFSDQGETKIDDLDTENMGLSFKWNHKASQKNTQELIAYISRYYSFYENLELEDEIIEEPGLEVSEINIRSNEITDIGINIKNTTQLNERQKLQLGYQLTYIDLGVAIEKVEPFDTSDNESLPQKVNTLNNALFAEYTYNFNRKSLINTGLRLVHYGGLDKIFVEPRVNFEYAVLPSLRVKAAVERRNQSISQLIEFNQTELRLENNLWRLSDNRDYPLLSSNQVSGGLLFKLNHLNIDVDAYYRDLDGLTTFTSGFSNPIEELKPGESTVKGVDVLVKYKYDKYRIWAGYTHNNITYNFPTLELGNKVFPGNNDVAHNFRISSAYTSKNWQFSLGWQIRSGKPFTPVNEFELKVDQDGENAGVIRFGDTNSDRLPTYHRLDASILHDFYIGNEKKKYKAQLGIAALNIYNRIRPIDVTYRAEVKPLDDGGIPKPGTTGATRSERELIVEQVLQRFSLGFTPNIALRVFF